MNKREHLHRLDDWNYRGEAVVHWTLTVRDRNQGWLSDLFYMRFREVLTHTVFRYELACPIFCLMPDHLHLIWMGLSAASDQLVAMRYLRKSINGCFSIDGFQLQDQAFDHVLRDDERQVDAFHAIVEYIARNPERAGLVPIDGFATYAYTGCLVPGYPELHIFESSFWEKFDRILSFLRANGLIRVNPSSRPIPLELESRNPDI